MGAEPAPERATGCNAVMCAVLYVDRNTAKEATMAEKIIQIRGVREEVARQFSIGAAVRGITQAEYLFRLMVLRDTVADLADAEPEDGFREIVETLQGCKLGKVNA